VVCGKVNARLGYSGFATFTIEHKQNLSKLLKEMSLKQSIGLCDDNIRLRAENDALRKAIKWW
jgi:hypothetical protein